MDPRTSANRVVAGARERLDRFNARHPWSHNDHYHGWILRNLPDRRGTALDVGCGRGLLLERLAEQFSSVTGIDADAGMARTATARLAAVPQVSVQHQGMQGFADGVPDGGFDLVTMVAVLHHLDLEQALRTAARLLAPRGRLLVVGLARYGSWRELPLDLTSGALNPLVGLVKHPRRASPGRTEAGTPGSAPPAPMPMRDPDTTFAEISATAARLLPGAVARRRLYFRYTLRWTSPG